MSTKKDEKEIHELTDLHSMEVSLVDRGANLKKRFPIFKEKGFMEHEEILKAVLDTEVDEESNFSEWFEKAGVSDKGQGALKSALRILNAYKDELPKDALDKLAAAAGYPAPKAKQKEDEEEEEDRYPKPKEKGKKVSKSADGDDAKLPDNFQAILKAQKDEIEAVRKESERVKDELKKERDARELEGWIAKAKSELLYFPGKSIEEMGAMLKSLSDSNPELAKAQFESMKTASDALKSSKAFGESCGSAFGKSASGSALDRIEKMAAGLVEKSADPKFTKEKATSLVLERNPELYTQYRDEHPAQFSNVRQ